MGLSTCLTICSLLINRSTRSKISTTAKFPPFLPKRIQNWVSATPIGGLEFTVNLSRIHLCHTCMQNLYSQFKSEIIDQS